MYITRREISEHKKDKILLGYCLCLIQNIEDEDLIKSLNCYEIVKPDIITNEQAQCA